MAICLDHQDIYSPGITLEEDPVGALVFRKGHKMGVIDVSSGSFRRDHDGLVFTFCDIDDIPPGRAWLKR